MGGLTICANLFNTLPYSVWCKSGAFVEQLCCGWVIGPVIGWLGLCWVVSVGGSVLVAAAAAGHCGAALCGGRASGPVGGWLCLWVSGPVRGRWVGLWVGKWVSGPVVGQVAVDCCTDSVYLI